jgi:LmbE family N-acetylglucosaminyl deacetylase
MDAFSRLLLKRLARAAHPFLRWYGLLNTSLAYKRTAVEWEPGAESVLVLAPHMDDETLGCGGTLAKHRQRGANVLVVFLTDGRQGSRELDDLHGEARSQKQKELVATRKREAERALEHLGIKDFVFLDAEDFALAKSETAMPALRRILEERRPQIVYVPFFLEQHPDHVAASTLLLEATQAADFDFRCMCYEVWTPLFPNCVVNIDETIDVKRAALSVYVSQLADADYLHFAVGLSAYRASAFARHYAKYAEAFCSLPLAEYRALVKAHCPR